MPITFKCDCGRDFQVRDDLAGKKAKCPGCGTVLVVPTQEVPSSTPPPIVRPQRLSQVAVLAAQSPNITPASIVTAEPKRNLRTWLPLYVAFAAVGIFLACMVIAVFVYFGSTPPPSGSIEPTDVAASSNPADLDPFAAPPHSTSASPPVPQRSFEPPLKDANDAASVVEGEADILEAPVWIDSSVFLASTKVPPTQLQAVAELERAVGVPILVFPSSKSEVIGIKLKHPIDRTTVFDALVSGKMEARQVHECIKFMRPGRALASLSGLPQIRVLDLYGFLLTDEDLRQLSQLQNLEELYLPYSPIRGQGLANLVGLSKLRRLDISCTHVDESAFQHLTRMSRLKELGVFYTHTTFTFADSTAAAGTEAPGKELISRGVKLFANESVFPEDEGPNKKGVSRDMRNGRIQHYVGYRNTASFCQLCKELADRENR